MTPSIRRRDFITLLGSAAAAWPLAARAQQTAMPVVGFLSGRAREESADDAAAFRQGLNEMGYTIGRNVALEYRWSEGHDERLPELAAELVSAAGGVIAAVGGNNSAFAAKAATADIPIVFTSGADPIKVGLVTSLNRPGGNVTGVSWFGSESLSKRLGILGELVPNIKLAVLLVNPNMPELAGQPEAAQQTAHALGWQLQVVKHAAQATSMRHLPTQNDNARMPSSSVPVRSFASTAPNSSFRPPVTRFRRSMGTAKPSWAAA
jgi:putative tryptophan/tyrosine transport system substrate-binding protein